MYFTVLARKCNLIAIMTTSIKAKNKSERQTNVDKNRATVLIKIKDVIFKYIIFKIQYKYVVE